MMFVTHTYMSSESDYNVLLVAFSLRCKHIRCFIFGGGMRGVGLDDMYCIEDIMGAVVKACCISAVVAFETLRVYLAATSLNTENTVVGGMPKEG